MNRSSESDTAGLDRSVASNATAVWRGGKPFRLEYQDIVHEEAHEASVS